MAAVLLMEPFHSNRLDDAFDGGAGAGYLVDGGGLGPLRRTRSHRSRRRLIIDETVIELRVRLQYTLRPLVHFLDVFVDVLDAFVRLGQRLVRRDDGKAIGRIDILEYLAIVVEVRVVAHADAVLVEARVVREDMRVLDAEAESTIVIDRCKLFALQQFLILIG